MNSDLLNTIETLLSHEDYKEAIDRINHLAFEIQIQWEKQSDIFRTGLERINWWETLFSHVFPVTYDRLKRSISRRQNAIALFKQIQKVELHQNLWRNLLIFLDNSQKKPSTMCHLGTKTQISLHPADEFGIDKIHTIVHKKPNRKEEGGLPFTINVIRLQQPATIITKDYPPIIAVPSSICLNMTSFMSNALHPKLIMTPIQLWSVPFQDAVIVLFQNIDTREIELIWIPNEGNLVTTAREITHVESLELSLWAINHNNVTEHPSQFCAPPFLHGDPTLFDYPIIISSTEGRTDIPNVKTALISVTIRHQHTLLFDQLKQQQQPAPTNHWRKKLTLQLWEPQLITCSCFVLDAFLLYASQDGILRAHPRGNPNSTYHVEDMETIVSRMTSLYNVVALIHSYHVLEVRSVQKKDVDPFIHFPNVLYSIPNVDAKHPPLLYGPYVIYASLDGNWYRVLYDTIGCIKGENQDDDDDDKKKKKKKEIIKIPLKPGWKIVSIKNANWRYWTIVLRNPESKLVEDYLLLADISTI
jgi:hypothetical protein